MLASISEKQCSGTVQKLPIKNQLASSIQFLNNFLLKCLPIYFNFRSTSPKSLIIRLCKNYISKQPKNSFKFVQFFNVYPDLVLLRKRKKLSKFRNRLSSLFANHNPQLVEAFENTKQRWTYVQRCSKNIFWTHFSANFYENL